LGASIEVLKSEARLRIIELKSGNPEPGLELLLQLYYVCGLISFGSLGDLKFDILALF
jgi:hypothetical protein